MAVSITLTDLEKDLPTYLKSIRPALLCEALGIEPSNYVLFGINKVEALHQQAISSKSSDGIDDHPLENVPINPSIPKNDKAKKDKSPKEKESVEALLARVREFFAPRVKEEIHYKEVKKAVNPINPGQLSTTIRMGIKKGKLQGLTMLPNKNYIYDPETTV